MNGPTGMFGTGTAVPGALNPKAVYSEPSALAVQPHPNELFCGPINEQLLSRIGEVGICHVLCPR